MMYRNDLRLGMDYAVVPGGNGVKGPLAFTSREVLSNVAKHGGVKKKVDGKDMSDEAFDVRPTSYCGHCNIEGVQGDGDTEKRECSVSESSPDHERCYKRNIPCTKFNFEGHYKIRKKPAQYSPNTQTTTFGGRFESR